MGAQPIVASSSPSSTVAPSATHDRLHGAGTRRADLVLHLHGLHGQQALARLDRLAHGDPQPDHAARDLSTDDLADVDVAGGGPARRPDRAGRPAAADSTRTWSTQPSTVTS